MMTKETWNRLFNQLIKEKEEKVETFISKGDRVVFEYDGVIRKGTVERYWENLETGKRTLCIQDDTRSGEFRSFDRNAIRGLVNLTKVPN